MLNRILIILLASIIWSLPAKAKHIFYEKTYQKFFCNKIGGGTEYYLLDKSGRVDCITKDYAIEVDFAPKWAEAVGQSLFYGLKTDKKPGILLILETPEDQRQLKKLEQISKAYQLKIWTITPEDLR